MATPKDSAGDLVRGVYLLWGHHPHPGRSGLSVDRIVDTGVDLADAEGHDAVTMRKVADRLGVGTMSLYTHVPSKDDLVALMVDTVTGEAVRAEEVIDASRDGWRAAMTAVAGSNRELYRNHPWLLDVKSPRSPIGPNISRKYELELRPLDGIGLSDLEMDAALNLILSHVEAVARTDRYVLSERRTSGMSDEGWWEIVGPALSQVMAQEDYPVSGRVGSAVGEEFRAAQSEPGYMLEFGLQTILDGIAVKIGGRDS